MSREEIRNIWGHEEKSVDEFYSTKFLELLLKYNYVWSPDDQKTFRINLGQIEKVLFLRNFGEFVQDFDELQASVVLSNIKEIYDEEYGRLLAASKKKNESSLFWFPLAHELFRKSMNKESDEENQQTSSISSQNFLDPESGFPDERFIFKDPLSPTSEELTDEDLLSPIIENFAGENPFSLAAEVSANDETLELRNQVFTINNSVSLKPEASAESKLLSSGDEAFVDCNSLPSSSEEFLEQDSCLITVKEITSIDSLLRDASACKTRTYFSPDASISFYVAVRSSPSPAARKSLSPAAIAALSDNARTSPSPAFKRTSSELSSFKESTSPMKRQICSVTEESNCTSSLKTIKERNQVTRTTFSPVASSRFPSARSSLSPTIRRSLSPAARTSISPTARISLSPSYKRTLSFSHISTSPGKQQRFDVIKESEKLNTSKTVKQRNRVRRRRSHTIPKRKLQPLIDLVKPAYSGKEITCCPTYSGAQWALNRAIYGNDIISDSIESVSNPTRDVKSHSISSRSPRKTETLSGKEKSASGSLSLCPYITDYSNIPGSYQQGTETAESSDQRYSEALSIVQSSALLATESVNRRPAFAVTGGARMVDSSRIFANRAACLLERLPPRLASECEAFILHFLHETLKRK